MGITYISLLTVCLVGITCVMINQINILKQMSDIKMNQKKLQILHEELKEELKQID